MGKMSSTFLIFTVFLIYWLGNEANAVFGCTSRERDALSTFKASLSDPSDRLSSWNASTDCCKWQGVKCDQLSGHVIGLDLQNKRYGDSYNSTAFMLHSEALDSSILDLKHLSCLDLSGNDFHRASIPSFLGLMNQMQYLSLSQSNFSGPIPISIGNLSALENLSLHTNKLNGEIPVSFFNSLSKLQYLWLGSNSLKFVARSDWIPPFQLEQLGMGASEIGAVFPQWIQTQNKLRYLNLPSCRIGGEIPESLCEMKSLYALVLSDNNLSGSLPGCMGNLNMLQLLHLSANRLSGVIPNSIGGAYSLKWLQLSNNRFSGELPYDLRNCTKLEFLDIGENAISGKLPKWMGTYLLKLRVLQLRSNELYDTIPSNLCQLSGLQVLDLAVNKFTGTIPYCIHNFTQMELYNNSSYPPGLDNLRLMIKGMEQDYSSNLGYVVHMDLSSNNLIGEIPLELTRLVALRSLNLSHNHLQGHIPRKIGDMNLLESLDLSNNNLSGIIPEGLSKLTFLSHLNLSSNKLTGEIPTGNQLQTLIDASIYEGNPGLCGAPLPKKCHEERASPNLENHDVEGEEDKTERIWLYGIVMSGFATGFWGRNWCLGVQNWLETYLFQIHGWDHRQNVGSIVVDMLSFMLFLVVMYTTCFDYLVVMFIFLLGA